jgi:hypothetical protein
VHQFRFAAASAFVLAAVPAMSVAAEPLLTPARIFGDSAPIQKLIILGLVASILAAITITALKLVRGPALTGGSAFVSGLRLGGPLLGAFGAAYSLLNGFIGIANIPVPPTITVVAPGVAESLFVLCLGILAAIVAVFGHWLITARIDRAVLKG